MNLLRLKRAIPGELNGYHKAYEIAGKLPWAELFEPTIKLCEEGYEVSKSLASALKGQQERIKKNTALREMYVDPETDSVYVQGDIIKRLKYAQTLRTIATFGYKAFYDGVLTDLIVKEINDNGN